ncbi:UDP-N-acetylglucosamine--undecaprenyl-phosphate N-acetylglucosaminephosphotransferase [Arenicella sp. 4NH20-0111]|uniref:MraY family glycosyltransferase n=1 Tax=Arenicella sp. 4NH20-0111 TaxID=3127648 RepID=UPI00310AFAA9
MGQPIVYVLFALIGITVISVVVALVLAHYAEPLKLLAQPGEHRLHQKATPMVGGLAVYSAVLVGVIFLDGTHKNIMPALMFMCAIGALDDRFKLPSWSRFVAQALAAFLMIKMTGVQLHSLGYLTPDNEVLLNTWSVPLTLFATIGVINAVNMSDGHDGLAASLVLLVLIALLFIGGGGQGLIMISIAAVIGFLFLNLRLFRDRAKIFLGDAGSTMLGLLLAYLLIKYSQLDRGIWPVTALWLLALPLIDAVAVLLVRPLRGNSPFAADRIHYHHQLVDRGVGVNVAVLIAVISQAGFIALGLWAWRIRIADHLQLIAFLALFACYVVSLMWFTRKSRG